MATRWQGFSTLRRVAALVCAGAYLTGGVETLPQALALGAWLEGSHTVRVARDGEQVTVVLSHERSRPGGTPHRHGAAVRILYAFAAQPAGQADHVACFAAGSICENRIRGMEAKARNLAPAAANLLTIVSSETIVSQARTLRGLVSSAPRPQDGLRLLRSTVLLV